MKRVYIAGAYSADNVLEILNNMRRGMRAGLEVLMMGCAPFVPWFDYHFQLMLRDDKGECLGMGNYYEYSASWLLVSDAVLVLPNSEKSLGTSKEIQLAKEQNIPVFRSIKELNEYFLNQERQ